MLLLRAFLASLVLVDSLASARYVGGGYSFENDWREVFTTIKPRQANGGNNDAPTCRQKCGSCGSSCPAPGYLNKRHLPDLLTSTDKPLDKTSSNRLVKRVLVPLTQGQIGGYIRGKLNALQQPSQFPNSDRLNLVYTFVQNGGLTDQSFAVQRRFADYTGYRDLNFGVEGLVGCTVLTVVSRAAVYMAHFYENYAFDNDFGVDPNAAFQANCLNLISGTGQRWEAVGDAIDPSLFTGNNGPAVAYIMTPRAFRPPAGWNSQAFQARIAQLADFLESLIPGLTVSYYNYNSGLAADPRNLAFFEYDPNADGYGTSNFRLFYESFVIDGRHAGILH